MKDFLSLEWIPAFTKWCLKAASYAIELPMIAAAIYVMLASSISAWNSPDWFNRSLGLLLASPEILLPGAILRASAMKSRGEAHKAKVTISVIACMASLTALTLACIMIFHLPDTSPTMEVVLFLRVLASLAYSIITRIDMDNETGGPAAPPDFMQHLTDLAAQLRQEIETLRQETRVSVRQQADTVAVTLRQEIADVSKTQQETLADLSQRQEQAQNLMRIETHRLLSQVQASQVTIEETRPTGHKPALRALPAPATRRKAEAQGQSEDTLEAQITALLDQDKTLTVRELAGRVNTSIATAGRIRKAYFENLSQAIETQTMSQPG
jgi:hypothetical protein